MYKSPISIYETAMQTILEHRENAIFAKVQDAFDVQVDKEELIRALQYDRKQYHRGFADGCLHAQQEVVRCMDCVQWHRHCGITDSPNGHCFTHDIEMNGVDFCSYGERKDNG